MTTASTSTLPLFAEALPGVEIAVSDLPPLPSALDLERGVAQIHYGETTGQVIIISAHPRETYQIGDSRPLWCEDCRRVTRHDWTGKEYVCAKEHTS